MDAAVAKALSKTPADRFASAGDFVRALEAKPADVRAIAAAPERGRAASRDLPGTWCSDRGFRPRHRAVAERRFAAIVAGTVWRGGARERTVSGITLSADGTRATVSAREYRADAWLYQVLRP